jgi:uncharacterized protein (TIGR00369 family)
MGGVLCDIADAAMGMAYAGTLNEGETFTTLELKINFLRPVWTAHLRATAIVVHRGRTVGLAECDVTDEQQRLIARATSTCMRLRGEQAKDRLNPSKMRCGAPGGIRTPNHCLEDRPSLRLTTYAYVH